MRNKAIYDVVKNSLNTIKQYDSTILISDTFDASDFYCVATIEDEEYKTQYGEDGDVFYPEGIVDVTIDLFRKIPISQENQSKILEHNSNYIDYLEKALKSITKNKTDIYIKGVKQYTTEITQVQLLTNNKGAVEENSKLVGFIRITGKINYITY